MPFAENLKVGQCYHWGIAINYSVSWDGLDKLYLQSEWLTYCRDIGKSLLCVILTLVLKLELVISFKVSWILRPQGHSVANAV